MKTSLFYYFIFANIICFGRNNNICLAQDFDDVKKKSKFGTEDVVEMGINISYNNSHLATDDPNGASSRNGFEFSPYVGFFIGQDFEMGMRFFDYRITHSSNTFSNTSLRTINVLVAPTIYLVSGILFHPFIEPQVGISFLNNKISVAALTAEENYRGVVFGGRIGIKTEIVQHVLLNISYQYQSISVTRESNSKNRTEVSNLFSIGMTSWFFSK